MPITQEIRDALDLKNLDLPEELRIQSIEVEEHVDSTGEDSLRVTIVIDESMDDFKIPSEAVWKIKQQIHDALLSRGIDLFPYTFLAKPSDLQHDAARE